MEADRSRDNKVRCAVVDTNVLIYSFLYKIDLASHLKALGTSRILIPEAVISEIKKLSAERSGKEARAAKLAIEAVKRWINDGIADVVTCSTKTADEAVLETAEKFGCHLITNDKELRMNARKRGVITGYLRKRNRIEIADE